MKKSDEARAPRSTWNNTPDDEPVFIMRAQDALGPAFVRHWANMAHALGAPRAKVLEARDLAAAMERYLTDRGQVGKTPD